MYKVKKLYLISAVSVIGILVLVASFLYFLKLSKELSRTEKLKTTLQQSALTAHNSLTQANKELSRLRSELSAAHEGLSRIEQTQVGPLQKKAENMKESLLIRDTQLSELKKALEVNEEANALLRARNDSLRKQLEGLKAEYGMTGGQGPAAEETARKRDKKSLVGSGKPDRKSAKEIGSLTRKISEMAVYSKRQDEEMKMLRLKVGKLENTVDTLERELFLARAEVVEKKSTVDLLNVQKEMLSADITQWNQEKARLEKAKDLQIEKAGLLAKVDSLTKALSAKQKQMNALQENLKSLNSEVLRKDEKVRGLEAGLASLDSQRRELQEQLVNQQVLLEEASALSGGLKERLFELSRLLAEKEFQIEKNSDTIVLLQEELSDARSRKIKVFDALNPEKTKVQATKEKLESILNQSN
jgi:chromosome segregation ATPase